MPTAPTRVTDDVTDNLATYHNELIDYMQQFPGPNGFMANGYLSPTVASNNLTLTLLNKNGNTPSSTDPVAVVIGNTVRTVTSALSFTITAGTNTFNAGATTTGTKEIDLFAYMGWKSGSSTICLLGSRIPYARLYSDFSTTATAETYAAYSTQPASTDDVVCIGRFAATLSTGAGYTWTVPSYTSINLINYPIFNTRTLTWVPTLTGYSANPTNTVYEYVITNNYMEVWFREATNGTSNATSITASLPLACKTLSNAAYNGAGNGVDNGAALTTTVYLSISSGATTVSFFPNGSAGSTWTNSAGKAIRAAYIKYPIA